MVSVADVKRRHESRLMKMRGVVGVGIGDESGNRVRFRGTGRKSDATLPRTTSMHLSGYAAAICLADREEEPAGPVWRGAGGWHDSSWSRARC